jgi:hypothetical protein
MTTAHEPIEAFNEAAAHAPEEFAKGRPRLRRGDDPLRGVDRPRWAKRSGLNCISWHCRLSEIGRNRPKSDRKVGDDRNRSARPANAFHDDPIGF